MKNEHNLTRAEKRERKYRPKMAVSGRNTKRLAQELARRPKVDPSPRRVRGKP